MEVQPSNSPAAQPGVVAVLRCEDYDAACVYETVGRGLALLGGVETFVRPGERLLLKPNLLVGKRPERAVTSHPVVFEAVARHFLDAGAVLSYGDSPGFGRPEGAAKRAGIAAAAQRLGIPLTDFRNGRAVSFPDGHQIKQFVVANGALDVDGIISLPKLKTHALTRLTGAVKNQFGCIPGMLKGEFHARMHQADRFAAMLVDLARLLAPRLHVMDGIVAMEGNGPQSGPTRPMHTLLFSTDPVAMDAAACRLVNLDPTLVHTNVWGERLGLGTYSKADFVGDDIESLVCRKFDVNRDREYSATMLNRLLARLMKNLIVPRPVINEERCTRCGHCVSCCPVEPKAVDFRTEAQDGAPTYDYARCIRCYCCQEMCPEGAIKVETPPLGRLIHQ